MFTIGLDRVSSFNCRNHIVQKISFEGTKRRSRLKDVAFRSIILLSTSIWHHDDHWNCLAVRDQVVQQHVRGRETLPFRFIAANPMQQIEHRILFLCGITRRRIDVHLSLCANRLRFVLNHFQFAMSNAVSLCHDAVIRIGINLLIIRSQFNRPAKPVKASSSLLKTILVRCVVGTR